MKNYNPNNIRNIAIIGHNAVGKTALTEAFLYISQKTERLGTNQEKNTISDFDLEERKRGISISTSIIPFEWKNNKVNIIDTPGYFDFIGEQIQGLKITDVAMITVCGLSGVQVGTKKVWNYCIKNKIPTCFFINKLDRENSSFEKAFHDLKTNFKNLVLLQYPIGKESNLKGTVDIISKKAYIYNKNKRNPEIRECPDDLLNKIDEYRNNLIESIAETDESLLDKYLESGDLDEKDIYNGLVKACFNNELSPVMCGSAYELIGIDSLLDNIINVLPSPNYNKLCDENKKFSAFVFKTIADPFIGKISIFKVMSGKLRLGLDILNSSKNKSEKINNLYYMYGKTQLQTKEIIAGDIGAVAKLQYTNTGDTLCTIDEKVLYNKVVFPKFVISMAAIPKTKGDEDKISSSLNKLLDEDLTLKLSRDIENAEIIISGMGEIHLEIIANKLKNKFGAEVILREPKIPYRETIKGIAQAQGKYKKQTGGHGQYGDVKIKFEPRIDGEDGLEFVDKVVGGVVPRNFIPAVEKGLKDCINKGIIAGYPVIKLKATLYDGSYHPVDSSEMSFKIAASMAYKKGLELAKPILLEPIMNIEVLIPDEYMGDIIADLNKRRGRILGMELVNNNQKVIAEVPMAEICKYSTDLSSLTQSNGEFSVRFERYEEVPKELLEKIIEDIKK